MLEREAYMWLGHLTTFRQGDIEKLFLLFGSAGEIYKNLYEDRAILQKLTDEDMLKETTASEILNDDVLVWDKDLNKRMKDAGIMVTTPADMDYPTRLRTLTDKPLCIYYRGDIGIAEAQNIVAIIGSRRVSGYGMQATEEFSRELAYKGITIISGMAYGVDGKAHRSCLAAGGKTIAVLGGGVDICYPRTNMDIYFEMCESHLVLSEYEPGEAHKTLHFPARNRIISGMSDGVLVTEAALKSGTIITVDRALEQGKTIYAVPGRMSDIMSKGTNNLIKQGAMLVDSPADIIRDILGIEMTENKKLKAKNKSPENIKEAPEQMHLSPKEKDMIGHLGYEPVFVDELIRFNDMNISDTLSVLRSLETKGLISSVEHSYYVLKR